MTVMINDLHIGAIRTGGTTPTTAWQLRQNLLRDFNELLNQINDDLVINGDLFDTANVPMHDLLETWRLLSQWLTLTGATLFLVAGNHDLSKSSTQLSSFQFLCKLLTTQFPQQVVPVFEPRPIRLIGPVCWYAIPHLPNQELFNLALEQVPPNTKYLLVHCNYDNKFAEAADHSLNMSAEQAMKLPVERIIFAHEHQRRDALNGKVLVVGNQMPSSVADCLGNDAKYMLSLGTDKVEWHCTWERKGNFSRMDWRELADDGAEFIRVEGTATDKEAAEMVSAIAKFRSRSKALVITNAVKIQGIEDEAATLTLEEIKGFDVLGALLKHLEPREQEVVRMLLKEQQ
jgi:metallophosphoesterase superfamily enzyme